MLYGGIHPNCNVQYVNPRSQKTLKCTHEQISSIRISVLILICHIFTAHIIICIIIRKLQWFTKIATNH